MMKAYMQRKKKELRDVSENAQNIDDNAGGEGTYYLLCLVLGRVGVCWPYRYSHR